MIKKLFSLTFRFTLISLLILTGSALIARLATALIFRSAAYTLESVPARRVAIIFGARVYPSGRLSAMLADRVQTGVDLYRTGKVDLLLMTGDNSTLTYNEPDAMRRFALDQGVPATAMAVDDAGFNTYASCYRAHAIFGLSEAIAVTQDFHLDRALMLCNALGVQTLGVAADYQRPAGYSRLSLTYSTLREFPATLNALLDLIFRPTPILGEPISILNE
jgi:SanA protein